MVLSRSLVWGTPWLPAGLCFAIRCHAGLQKQTSCYWCRPFTLSGSLHARSTMTGPTMVVWAHAQQHKIPLGNISSPVWYRYTTLCLARDLPCHPKLAGWPLTCLAFCLWHVGSQSGKLWCSAVKHISISWYSFTVQKYSEHALQRRWVWTVSK